MNFHPEKPEEENPSKTSACDSSQTNAFNMVMSAFSQTNKYFWGMVLDISFSLWIAISAFVPLWVLYIHVFGIKHVLIKVCVILISMSLQVVILFMMSLSLFNRTHKGEEALKWWAFTKKISWPWIVESAKSSLIIILATCCFVIPGIIKLIHYIFVSFVVFFNRDYQEGKINALKYSKKLSKGLGFWIFAWLIPLMLLGGFHFSVTISQIIFTLTNSLYVIYPTLMLSVYIECLIIAYLFSILYFVYTIKDQKQMIGA